MILHTLKSGSAAYTQVVPEKRPLNGFNSSCSSIGDLVSRAVEHVAVVTCVSEQCEN